MMRRPILPVLIAAAALAGCAQVSERVVLLPDAEGRSGALAVRSGNAETQLAAPYAAVELKGDRLVSRTFDADEVRRRYAAVLAAQPPGPRTHTLYFQHDKGGLTPESLTQLEKIKAELAASPAGEVVIIGHTDRVGALEFNDRLSLTRAESVRGTLLAIGIAAAAVTVVGRGEREPAVATADEVPEARNRRVVIKVR